MIAETAKKFIVAAYGSCLVFASKQEIAVFLFFPEIWAGCLLIMLQPQVNRKPVREE